MSTSTVQTQIGWFTESLEAVVARPFHTQIANKAVQTYQRSTKNHARTSAVSMRELHTHIVWMLEAVTVHPWHASEVCNALYTYESVHGKDAYVCAMRYAINSWRKAQADEQDLVELQASGEYSA